MSSVSRFLDLDRSNVTALLGPTNTGKTHRAIERMLAHRTGMIGLPLRLLAREVYDRITAAKGEHAVALVTGEEKRIPPAPRYFVCTVEAMPVDRPVAFLAVDEIQLCADRTRGHVFTDRLLHARGLLETWFLGSDTIAPLLERLIPSARVEKHERFSKLTATPPRKLASLPKRSAVVAFSAERVYELAERIRGHHGGTAVVLGALSPRARNAQIAMYQAGEVQHVVATDAIGMGLNLDIDHVAFAEVRKFDGRVPRALTPAEVGQIAGRAGRYKRDGTFGPITDLGELDPELVAAVEAHAFPPIEAIWWRNHELDTTSVEALLESLAATPGRPELLRMRDAEDHRALEALVGRPDVQARAVGEEAVSLLWDVCGVPDFRKTQTGHHEELLAELYGHLLDDGKLPEELVAKRIRGLDRIEGDIEILMARIAGIRTWTFITHRSGWLDGAAQWQSLARDIEDKLSDALHERLTQRFVDARAMAVVHGRWEELGTGADEHGVVRAGGEVVGQLDGLRFTPAPGLRTADRAVRRALIRGLASEVERRVQRCVEAPHEAFTVDAQRMVVWEGAPVAHLEPGPHPLEPRLAVLRLELLGAGARERISRRMTAWLRDLVGRVTEPLDRPEADALSVAGKGLIYAVGRGLGSVPRHTVEEQIAALAPEDRKNIARLDVRIGTAAVYVASLLRPPGMAARGLLWNVWSGSLVAVPEGAPASVAAAGAPKPFWEAIGYRVLGPRAVRVDMVERVASRMRELGRAGGEPEDVISWLGCTREELPVVLRALGWERKDDRWVRAGAPPRRPDRRPKPRVTFRG
jgi:ATP-dependent RNA helicase SUPV3L1/SUV3